MTISQMINKNEFGSKTGISLNTLVAFFSNGLNEFFLSFGYCEDYILLDEDISPLANDTPLFFLLGSESSSFT